MIGQKEQGRADIDSSLPLDLIDENQVEERFTFNFSDLPAMFFFWLLVVIVFLQFFTRYVMNDSLGWTEEIARFLLILVGFVGSITAVRKGSHIFLEFLYRYTSAGVTKSLVLFSDLTCIIFYGYCANLSFQVAMRMNQTLVSIPLPKSYIYWTIGVCFLFMACYSLVWLVKRSKLTRHELVSHINNQILPD
ncbi:TRAP transporter small permease [Marinomonas balearica]|uniref:TRAP transporter small permease protein n=1 Tax=Marinomonas balearica TaxID=491947 RepID=A0A4R6M3I0_9GAMM|nr:TRAP transporter small permease [Marinomonas balearica]TDO95837.1 TRAP-type C4-dicarboxylate transport system permease small subunit [Marinomonas balearica]